MLHTARESRKHHLAWAALRVALLIVIGVCLAGGQQSQLGLQITSPTNNTIVAPGQPLSITVVAINNTQVAQFSVVGEDPLGTTAIANSVPAQLALTIPNQISLRKYSLTAWGASTGGQLINSAPVSIDVERPDLPARLTADPGRFIFESLGEALPFRILASFQDGNKLEVSESSCLTLASSNTSVATADKSTGRIKAVGQGSATITATYTVGSQSVSVSIPVTVPKPVVTPSANALDFGNQNVGTSSVPRTVTLTNAIFDPAMVIGPVSALGDFSTTDDCKSSSPIAPGTSCTATVIFTPTVSGPETGTLFVPSSEGSMELSLTGTGVGQPGTTTTLGSSTNPTVYGQVTTLSSTVAPSSGTGTPTGSVTFDDGTNSVGSASLSNGQATLSLSSFSVGSHSLTAVYSGDANFLASTSSVLSQVVNQAATATALSSSSSPSTLNSSITLTANLSVVAPGAGTPTGTITFEDGSNVLGTSSVSSAGQAALPTASLSVGSHSLLASYSGDANFLSSSATLAQQIAYNICVLYDQTRSVNGGATFPIKLYLCDVNGNDVSSSTIVLHATAVTNVSGYAGPVQSPGSANPDNDFRYDSTQGPTGGYIFNLSTTGLFTGTYSLQFTAGADPTTHAVNFGVK